MTTTQALETFPQLEWQQVDLKDGDWVFTPNEVFGSGGQDNQVFQYDSKINYSLRFGHEPKFFKLVPNDINLNNEMDLAFVRGQGGIPQTSENEGD